MHLREPQVLQLNPTSAGALECKSRDLNSYGSRPCGSAVVNAIICSMQFLQRLEKTYTGDLAGDKKWGFDWYYEKLYGQLPDVWPTSTT
jgi:hypothetical protein